MSDLSVQQLSHAYGARKVLQDISFCAHAGELTCLSGPSGSGKSTLLRLIAGLEPLQQGDISIGGASVLRIPAHERKIGMVFQHPSLFPHLTAVQNIAFGLRSLPAAKAREKSEALLHKVGLSGYAGHYPHQLSGGQQQRVALARALAPNPRLMLLDEPFSNLDPLLRQEMREEVVGILKEAHLPVIMVTHDPLEVLQIADKLILLRADGTLHQMGTPEAVYHAPIDAQAAHFFGVPNCLAATLQGDRIVTAAGTVLRRDYAPFAPEGAALSLLVREHGILLDASGVLSCEVIIESVSFRGGQMLVAATLPDATPLRFYCPCHLPIQPQQRLTISLNPKLIYVFAEQA